jgi:hypothetical protein
MNRRLGFITGAVAAAVTFATLTYAFGPKHLNHGRFHRYAYGAYGHYGRDCDAQNHQHHRLDKQHEQEPHDGDLKSN